MIAGIATAVAAAVIVPLVLVLVAWSRIDRVEFDPEAARIDLAAVSTTTSTSIAEADPLPTTEASVPSVPQAYPEIYNPETQPWVTPANLYPSPPPTPVSAPVPDSAHEAILIIGSDRAVGSSHRADVIMLALIPSSGANPLLVSLPRDLYLENPCGGGWARINAALNGCSGVSGPNLLSVVVEDFTGIPIDHFVMFDFDGFARVIDAAGGVEVCVDYPTFDKHTTPRLDLPAGCSTVGGKMALSWVRSRHTRQIVDGVEQAVPGVGDGTRNARQRDIVLQMLRRLSGFSNPAQVVSLAGAVPGAFTLDSGLSLSGAVSIAWDLRGRTGSIRTPRIPATQYTTPEGAWVLLPTEPFSETIG